MPSRTDITFASGDGRCAGWLYRPRGDPERSPCVVMAHGFGAQKEGRLDAFAERFADAGLAVLVFDYRHFGESTGEPAQLVDIARQHVDWQAAIACARGLSGIDPARIGLWGSSFSGGHVVWVAARDPRIAAVVSQIPHASGPATMREAGPKRLARLTVAGLRDQVAAMFGRTHYVPIVGPEGSLAAMATPDAEPGYRAMYPAGFAFRNEVPARVMLRLGTYSPLRDAAKVRCPLLVIVASEDAVTPPEPGCQIAKRAPRGELMKVAGGHFDPYLGEGFQAVSARAAEFFSEELAPSN